MKVIAFAATNHSKSINKQLVEYAASLLTKVDVEIIDLNDYELPLYGQDKEEELGHPKLAKGLPEETNGITSDLSWLYGSFKRFGYCGTIRSLF